ncbi:hypothetical protein FRC03_007609 [Tulasnella sp. 419]|nr:hypothetical protein FRC03_007609 [Tulasnella sp. 419]
MQACNVVPSIANWNALLQSSRLDCHLQQHTFSRMKELNVSPNAQTYQILLTRLIEERHFEMCIQLLDEMPSFGLTPNQVTMERLIVALAQSGYPRLAIDFVDSFESNTLQKLSVDIWLDILESAASGYYETGVDRAMSVLRDGHIALHEGLCLTVLNFVSRLGKVELAKDILQQLQNLGVAMREEHLEPVIEAYLVMKDTKSALTIFYSMLQLGLSPSSATLRPLTLAVRNDPDLLDSTIQVVDEFQASGKPSSILPYNALLDACTRRGELTRAIEILKTIKSKGIPPNIDTYNSLIHSCASQVNKDVGTAFWNELKDSGLQPNYRTFEKLIQLHLKEGPDYEAAFFYLEEMKSYGITPGVIIYEDFVKKCVRFHDSRLTLVLDEMKEMGYGISISLRRFMEIGGKGDILGLEPSASKPDES